MKRSILSVAVVCCFVLTASWWKIGDPGKLEAQSTTVNCPAVADTRLEQKAPTTNYATGTTLWGAGNVNSIGQLAEAAMKFDCSAIPSGSTITGANLKITVTFPTTDSYNLYQLKKAWTETGATWNNYASGAAWEVAGARGLTDRDTLNLGSFTGDGATGLKIIPLTSSGLSAVSAWVNGGANNGILLRPPLANDDVGFQSRETSGSGVLEVVSSTGTTYTLPLTADTRLEEKAPTTNYATGTTLYAAGNVNGIGQYAEAALTFDVSTIPPQTTLQSATLKINVNFPSVDKYEIYELKKAWTETGATWTNYASGAAWEVAGAKGSTDRASTLLGSVSAPPSGLNSIPLNAAGLAVVSGWVNQSSPNTGIVLRAPLSNDDVGFSSRETATPPVLEVTYTTGTTSFKLIHYNIHHGVQADGTTKNIDDVAQFVFDEQAPVIDINEPSLNGYGYTDYVAELETKLNAKFPGRAWDHRWLGADAILWMTPGSPGPLGMTVSTVHPVYTYTNHDGYLRTIGAMTFSIDSPPKSVTIAVTHLACNGASGCPGDNTSIRTAEVNELLTWDDGITDPLVVGGDFNAVPGSTPINTMTGTNGYYDADAGGMTTTDGGHRYDYIFYRKTSTQLTLLDHYVKTPLASNGQWPSDHRPVIAVFGIH